MSNQVTLMATTFTQPASTVPDTHGFRMYDSYSKTYDNNSESPIMDDIELLQYALSVEDEIVTGMIDHLKSMEKGMTINGVWYDYDEIKVYLEE